MTLRLFACIECDKCHYHFQNMVSIKGLDPGALSEEVHRIVLEAEEEEWQCRKNATEHLCTSCLDNIHHPF